ncbi:MAG: carboxymuconolactone decarboxylase family protein [Novosphingobium sp.]
MELKGYGDRLAERTAQVVGEGPKIAALADSEMASETRALVDKIRLSAGAGTAAEVPEYMRTMVKHPDLFRAQMEMGTVLFKGLISPRERELAVLRIGWLAGAPYEWGEHVKISQRYGVSREEIARVQQGSSAPGWSEHDAAILRGVEELMSDYAVSDATWDILAKTWDEAQLLEYPSMVGQYVVTAFIQNSIRSRPAPENPGLSHS